MRCRSSHLPAIYFPAIATSATQTKNLSPTPGPVAGAPPLPRGQPPRNKLAINASSPVFRVMGPILAVRPLLPLSYSRPLNSRAPRFSKMRPTQVQVHLCQISQADRPGGTRPQHSPRYHGSRWRKPSHSTAHGLANVNVCTGRRPPFTWAPAHRWPAHGGQYLLSAF